MAQTNNGVSSVDHDDDVLVILEEGRDRTLLVEWLSSLPRYAVTAITPRESLPRNYDLCLLDLDAFERVRTTLRTRVEIADPVFLPHLLLVSETGSDRSDLDASSDMLSDTVIDDVLTLPADQTVMNRRIENLLDARRASVRLAEREQQYQQLVELAPEAILLVRDRTIVYANEAADEIFASETDTDLTGTTLSTLVDPEDADQLDSLIDAVERGIEIDEFREIAMRSTTGSAIAAEAIGVRVTFEGKQTTQLLIRDVTAEHERQQQLDLFARAIETAAQGITIADARQEDTPLIYANDAFERITGYSTGEILGRNCRFLQGSGTEQATVDRIREGIDAAEPVTEEILNYRKDGTPFWNRLEIVPVRNTDGEVTHFLGLQRDITDRKEREERLNVLDRVLRHNLRNRLNIVRSYAEQVRQGVPDEEARAAAKIIDAVDDLLEVSDQVREFQSLISTHERCLQRNDLVAVVRSLAEGVADRYPDADLTVEVPESAPATVHETLPGALTQLVELAFAAPETTPSVTVRIQTNDQQVVVELIDHAGTIPESDMAAIGAEIETPMVHAKGLELWLIRWAVLYSNGEITVDERNHHLRMSFNRAA